MPSHHTDTLLKCLVTLLLFCLLSSLVSAEIFQWTDEHGQTHFGDRPPQGRQSTNISEKMQSINISKELSSPEMMLRHEQLKAKERQRVMDAYEAQQNQSKAVSSVCKEAKEALRKLKRPVVFLDEQGKEIKVSEMERKQRAKQMEDAMRQHCQ